MAGQGSDWKMARRCAQVEGLSSRNEARGDEAAGHFRSWIPPSGSAGSPFFSLMGMGVVFSWQDYGIVEAFWIIGVQFFN